MNIGQLAYVLDCMPPLRDVLGFYNRAAALNSSATVVLVQMASSVQRKALSALSMLSKC